MSCLQKENSMLDFKEWLSLGFQAQRIGHCDRCHSEPVFVMPDFESDPGEWDLCEGCFECLFLDHHGGTL